MDEEMPYGLVKRQIDESINLFQECQSFGSFEKASRLYQPGNSKKVQIGKTLPTTQLESDNESSLLSLDEQDEEEFSRSKISNNHPSQKPAGLNAVGKINGSKEQLEIRDALFDNDVIVEAVAGSGKTTTVLLVAKAWQHYNKGEIIMLTYNKRLRHETQIRMKENNFFNCEVHTLHSFCFKFYPGQCSDDYKMKDILSKKMVPLKLKSNFKPTLFIIDEAQDLTDLYFELVVKIIHDFNPNARLCFLGDRYQMIYQYNGADFRYLTMLDEFLPKKKWKRLTLSTSYRMTNETCSFINVVMLKRNLILANKSGPKPIYIRANIFESNLWEYLKREMDKYKEEEIFVLGYTIKSQKSPIRLFANWLVEYGNKKVYASLDDEKIDENVMKGKIVFTTFHQSKGLERKLVIVFDFDSSLYFKQKIGPEQHESKYCCPNEIYVAATRAIHRCIMIQHEKNDALAFLDLIALPKHVQFFGQTIFIQNLAAQALEPPTFIPISDLLSHIPCNVFTQIKDLIKFDAIREQISSKKSFELKNVSQQEGGSIELVSDINTKAIPGYCEITNRGTLSFFLERIIRDSLDPKFGSIDFDNAGDAAIQKLRNLAKNENDFAKIQNILYLANEYLSYQSGYVYKLKQITSYDWLEESSISNICEDFKSKFSENAIYESCFLKNIKLKEKSSKDMVESYVYIYGTIDCLDVKSVYKFCKDTSRFEHLVPIAIYRYLIEKNGFLIRGFNPKLAIDPQTKGIMNELDIQEISQEMIRKIKNLYNSYSNKNCFVAKTLEKMIVERKNFKNMLSEPKNYYAYNFMTGDKFQLTASIENIEKVIQILVNHKLKDNKGMKPDTEFKKATLEIIKKYFPS